MTGSTSATDSRKHLLRVLFIRLLLVAIIVGTLLFSFAGTVQYWNGWLFIAVFFVPATGVSIYLYKSDPSLLEKRMKVREKEREQKLYVKISLLWFLVSMAVPGLDFRFGWSYVPLWLVLVSVVVMLCGYILFVIVMIQNRFASRVVEIQDHQHVIDTGLYSVIRHPMYAAAITMYAATPLVLGSYYGLIATIPLPLILAYRIRNEEKVLLTGLAGYSEYTQRVRFRLIPHIW